MFFDLILSTGIFWDYENVPLKHSNFEQFLDGLRFFSQSIPVVFARIYARDKTLPERDEKLINKLELFDYRWVEKSNKNAVDNTMIRSCLDVVANREDIQQVVIITGDGDFYDLLESIVELNVRVLLIAQGSNYNKSLLSVAHRAYGVDFIAQNPFNWWITN